MIKWLRMKIARLYDRRDDTCWTNLAMWAMFGDRNDWDNRYQQICRESNPDTPYGYCGKCQVTNRFNDGPQEEVLNYE